MVYIPGLSVIYIYFVGLRQWLRGLVSGSLINGLPVAAMIVDRTGTDLYPRDRTLNRTSQPARLIFDLNWIPPRQAQEGAS